MKKNILILFGSLALFACQKSSQQSTPLTVKSNTMETPTVPPCVLAHNCPVSPNPITPAPTTDQLYAEGQYIGCLLAKSNKQAPLVVNVNAIYTVFYNTVNDPSFPASYKNGVNEGWIQCYSMGPLTSGTCPTVVVGYSGKSGWYDVNYCDWLSGNIK